MKFLTPIVAALAVLSAPAQGQLVAPQPGLWQQDVQILINGQDLMAQMRQMQAEMMKNMPPEARQQMSAMMGDMGGPQKVCITAEQAARATDPKSMLRDMQREQPHCTFEPVSTAGATVRFKGRCNDPHGFSGDVTGEFTQVNPRESTGSFTGKGRMVGRMEMPGMSGVNPGGSVDMRTTVKGRWLGADCGNVKP